MHLCFCRDVFLVQVALPYASKRLLSNPNPTLRPCTHLVQPSPPHIEVCICIYIYIHVRIYIFTYICVYIYTHPYVRLYIYIYLFIYLYIYIYKPIYIYTYMYIYAYVYIRRIIDHRYACWIACKLLNSAKGGSC